MAVLGTLHSARAAGKELQPPDLTLDFTGAGAGGAGGGGVGGGPGEVWVAHSALELLLAVVGAVESLADGVLRAPLEAQEASVPGGRASAELDAPDTPSERADGQERVELVARSTHGSACSAHRAFKCVCSCCLFHSPP